MSKSPTLLDVHADHRNWQTEAKMWEIDLLAWYAEHNMALSQMAEIVKHIDQHQSATKTHEKNIRMFADEIKVHEHELVQHFAKDWTGDVNEVAGDLAHDEATMKKFENLRQTHEQIKKQHHVTMAHILSLKKVLFGQ